MAFNVKHLDKPDYLILDLDPKAVPWQNVLDARSFAGKSWMNSACRLPKTSGSSGHTRLCTAKAEIRLRKDWRDCHGARKRSRSTRAEIATTQRSLAKRQKQVQVYVDAMQNARGKTIASVFSARAKPGATVSMPLSWKQVEKGARFQISPIRTRRDCWGRTVMRGKNFLVAQMLKL